jgi:hypothetical protein
LNDVAGEHHVSPIESVQIDASNGPNENCRKKDGGNRNAYFERVAGQLEDIPYRGYVKDEVAGLRD